MTRFLNRGSFVGPVILIVFLVESTCASAQTPTSQCADLQVKINELQAKVQSDERAIRNLGLDKTADEVEQWQQLSDEAKKQFERDSFDFLLTGGLEASKTMASKLGSLNPPRANMIIFKLRDSHLENDVLSRSIRSLAASSGKRATADDWIAFLNGVDAARDSSKLSDDVGKSGTELQVLADVLSIAVNDPRLKLLVADAQLTASAAYSSSTSAISAERIKDLTTLTESQLSALRQLVRLLTNDVQRLNEAKSSIGRLCEQGDLAGEWQLEATVTRVAQAPDAERGPDNPTVDRSTKYKMTFARLDDAHFRGAPATMENCPNVDLFARTGSSTFAAHCESGGEMPTNVTWTLTVSGSELVGKAIWEGTQAVPDSSGPYTFAEGGNYRIDKFSIEFTVKGHRTRKL